MAAPKTARLIERLGVAGFAPAFVEQCLPPWWDDEAENSTSAWLQLKLDLAQQLSLDPYTLIEDDGELRYMQLPASRFKHLQLNEAQQQAVNAFASGLAKILLAAVAATGRSVPSESGELRELLLRQCPWISLGELLTATYAFGIPVAELTAAPAGIKGMAAMTIGHEGRAAILTARRPLHPAQTAFFVAHELGHIALGHVRNGVAIIEAGLMESSLEGPLFADDEERAADAYALELLTGRPEFEVDARYDRGTAEELAQVAIEVGPQLRIDPGLVLLCFGRTTGRWPQVAAALQRLPDFSRDTTEQINRALRSQLTTGVLPDACLAYLDAVVAA